MPRPRASLLLVAMLITGCGAPPGSPAASPPAGAPGTPSPTAMSTVMLPTPSPFAAPTLPPTPSPSSVSSLVSSPSPAASPASPTVFRGLPLRRSAYVTGVYLTPGPDGTVAVSIDRDKGAVLVLYDARGRPRPGWPIEVPHSQGCDVVGFATDGSLRAVCDATDLPSAGNGPTDHRAWAFDRSGRVLDGWPVQIPEGYSTRVVGSHLVLLTSRSVGDGEWDGSDPAEVLSRSWLIRVAADGTMTTGTALDETANECWGIGWALGPDGIAYGASGSPNPPCVVGESICPSQMHALALDGAVGGWPFPIEGEVSYPDFGPDGTVVVTAGTYDRPVARIHSIDPRTHRIVATSPKLPIELATTYPDSDSCGAWPSTPRVAEDGTVFFGSSMYDTTYAFGPDLRLLPGWPRELPGELADPVSPNFDGLDCGWGVEPAAGPDGTLYLSLEPTSETQGGRLDAIAKNGKRPAGWPVKLTRAGSKFWDVAVGEDGTVYALAVEPEGKRKASATLLAIDPDGEARYAVTLLEP